MTIEVIERGIAPKDKKYEATCISCKSILQFLRSDVKMDSSLCNESFYTFKCPVCKKELYIDVNSAKEIKEVW